MFTSFTFTVPNRRFQCNIAHRLGAELFTGNYNKFARWQPVLISERFEHEPVRSLSLLNGDSNYTTIHCLYWCVASAEKRTTVSIASHATRHLVHSIDLARHVLHWSGDRRRQGYTYDASVQGKHFQLQIPAHDWLYLWNDQQRYGTSPRLSAAHRKRLHSSVGEFRFLPPDVHW